MAKKGAKWRPVQAKSLSDRSRKLYRQYVQKLQEASALGRQLKETVTSEWNAKYPEGIDAQVCAFNAINGVLQYVMKPEKKTRTSTKRSFDEDSGDDVFSSPPAESQETNKGLSTSKPTDKEPPQEADEDKIDTSGSGVTKTTPKWLELKRKKLAEMKKTDAK